MKTTTTIVAGLMLLGAGACVDNPAAPSTDRVPAGSAQTLQALVTGMVAQLRVGAGPTSAGSASPYYAYGSIMARDAIRPDPNETRWVAEFYESPPDPSDFIGASQWAEQYSVIRAAHSILKDQALLGLAAPEQAAARGFVRIIEAIAYLRLIEYRDNLGIAIQGDDPAAVDPIRTKQAVLAYTSALLDTALTDLATAGGITVPFTVPPGYRLNGNYGSADELRRLAHGLKGKAETLRATDQASPNAASATAAVTELNAALADAGTPNAAYLMKGPYHEYNPNAPESFANPLVDLKLLVTDNFVSSIMAGDARAQMIVPAAKQSATLYEASYRAKFTDPTNSGNLTLPLPIVRNAELYLLRAQAKLALGDLAGAMADVNVVHTVEGGLAPLVATSPTAVQDAILYEYRYSFLLQGPQHLVALRSYKRLNAAYVSQPGMPTPGPAADAFVQNLPIPKAESDARNGQLTPKP